MNETETKKSLGQHWLKDQHSLAAIVKAADVKAGDVVLEIGPGQGTLTDELLKAKAEVIGLEYDSELVKFLQSKYKDKPTSEIFVQEGDIRSYDFGAMPNGYKIVANIPYYLTANLLRKLIDTPHKPTVAALLVQKEVAEHVAAEPGQMSFISVATQFYYDVTLGAEVPAKLFTPPPKVDSQVLILKLRTEPLFNVEVDKFLRLVKVGFSSKRKTLVNNLSAGLQISKPQVVEMLNKARLKPTSRAQELSLSQWHELYAVEQDT